MKFNFTAPDTTPWAQISAALTLVNNTLSAPITTPPQQSTTAHVHDDIAVVEVRLNAKYLSFYTADSSGYTELFAWLPDSNEWAYTEDWPSYESEMP